MLRTNHQMDKQIAQLRSKNCEIVHVFGIHGHQAITTATTTTSTVIVIVIAIAIAKVTTTITSKTHA